MVLGCFLDDNKYCSFFTLNILLITLLLLCSVFKVQFLYKPLKVCLVGSSGLEPPTSRLSAECSSQLSYKPIFGVGQLCFRLFPHLFASLDAGGDEGNRTLDPLLAGQVLSQLSYTPIASVEVGCGPSKSNNKPETYLILHSVGFLYLITASTIFGDSSLTPCLVPVLHRKAVIQPHLPIRLPCSDLTPIIEPTFGSVLLAVKLLTSGIPNFHGLTGGVYKARERIHRGMLIRDY